MRLLTTTVTSLEMRRPPVGPVARPTFIERLDLAEIFKIPLSDYRALYQATGTEHHWTSRLLSDERLAQEIHNSSARIFLLTRGNQAAGWFELEMQRDIGEARIVHLGVLAAFRGHGLSGYLLDHAIHAAFAEGISRLTIETNTLDHPAALPLYQKHGFDVYATREVRTPSIDQPSNKAMGARS